MLAQYGVGANEIRVIESQVLDSVNAQLDKARKAENPDVSSLYDHIFAETTVITEVGERHPSNGEEVLMVDAALHAIEELMTDEERLYSKESDKFFVLSRSELDFEASQEDAIRWPMAEVTYNSKLLEPLSFQETKEFIANSLQLDGMKLSDFAS